MKRFFYLTTIAFVLLGLAGWLSAASQAQGIYVFVPVYSILGTVNDTPEAAAEGRQVVFYRSQEEYEEGIYVSGTVGQAGAAATPNRYLLNAARNLHLPLTVGQTYKVAVVRDSSGYGAGPVDVVISGKGYDIPPDMSMAYGAGVGPVSETLPPIIKQVWFGNRLYQEALVEKGEQFVVGSNPRIKADIEAQGTSGINASNVTILVNEGTANAKTYTLAAADITQTIYASDVPDRIQSLAVEYSIPEADPLPANQDSIVTVRAWNADNSASTSEACTVTVLGGPLRVVGPVVVYPSPFSQRRHGTCTIQYLLSADSNIDIYIYSASGQMVKKIVRFSGTEGGSAGINKVTWDGKTESGMFAGNAVYVGTLVGRDDNKLLARFKFTILD